ncbi:FAD-dependent oxidoreductase [Porticoccus sp.]
MPIKKIATLIVIALVVGAYLFFDGDQYLHPGFYQSLYQQKPLLTAGVYFLVYVVATGFSLPGAALLTVIAGMIFGLWTGVVLVSFASSLGATLAFMVSRLLLRDWVQARFSRYLVTVNRGIERDGSFHLFSMRLIPAIPFWVINLVMGLMPISAFRFYWVSQLGMLAGTMVYVNAGAEIGSLEEFSAAGLLTPGLLLSFLLLAIFPYLARGVLDAIKRRRIYRDYACPSSFDRNLVVIGAGSAGLVSAYISTAVKSKVTLVEKHRMGGDCLNTGCVPSKSLIRAARAVKEINRAAELGIDVSAPSVDLDRVMGRVKKVIRQVEPHDSVARYSALGVDCVQGEAVIKSPWEVTVNGSVITTRNIIIATGASPFVPPIPGLEQLDYLTSENIWELDVLPKRLLVIGGGPIGCELAQAFQCLGSQVTLVGPRLLPKEDEDVSRAVMESFQEDGIELLLGYRVKEMVTRGTAQIALVASDQDTQEITFDRVLIALGRKARTEGLGLESLGIELNTNGTVTVDEYLRTRIPNIFACGDVAGPYQFTHTAAHQAWYASVNALFGRFRKFKVDYRVIPRVTFTDPEVAQVGLTETEARTQGIEFEVTRYGLDDLDRALADNSARGFVKVLTVPGKDRILGASVVGSHAGELIAELVLAMKQGIGLKKILGTIHSYPTLSEANKYAAGNWQRAHTPQRILGWVEKYHRWQRH